GGTGGGRWPAAGLPAAAGRARWPGSSGWSTRRLRSARRADAAGWQVGLRLHRSRAVLILPPDHRNLVATVVVANVRHEGADEQQPAAAPLLQVRRVGGVGKFRRVEPGTFVSDHVDRLAARLPRPDVYAAVRILGMPAAFARELVIRVVVFLSQPRIHLEIPMLDGIHQRLT